MTKCPYYTSDNTEGRANLLSYSAEPDRQHTVVPNRTLFHLQGDGQPADAGWIDDERTETVLMRGNDVVHTMVKPLPPGIVNLRVDVTLRQLHARLHSTRHLIGLADTVFGQLPVKAHHWPSEGCITFTASKNSTLPDTPSLQEKINVRRASNLPKQMTFTDGLRRVRFGHLLVYPCEGTHVVHPSETGPVTITRVKMRKGQMVVSYTLVP